LPTVDTVESGDILDGVIIKRGAVRSEVNSFIFLRRLNSEKNAGIGADPAFHSDITFDNAVFELDVFEEGRPYQGLALEVIDDPGVGQVPSFRHEFNDIARSLLGWRSRGQRSHRQAKYNRGLKPSSR
jgi:hypothetical protein